MGQAILGILAAPVGIAVVVGIVKALAAHKTEKWLRRRDGR